MNRNIPFWKIVVALLGTAFVVDGILRLLPLRLFTDRAWEAALRYPVASGPFTPDFRSDKPAVNSDLPRLGNLPLRREARREIFSTDAEGFRLNGEPSPAHASILVGDSMTVGLGLSDHETLPADIERLGHGGALNAGWMQIKSRNIIRQADRLNMSSGTVIYLYMERQPLPTARDVSGVTRQHRYAAEDPWSVGKARQVLSTAARGLFRYSPVRIGAKTIHRKILDDRIFPNPWGHTVGRLTLGDGSEQLVYAPDMTLDRSREEIELGGIEAMSRDLAVRGLRFAVVLLPTKYTAYRPFLRETPPGESPGEVYLARLESALRERGVTVLNLSPFMIEATRKGLETGDDIYFRHDTHWNTRGIRLAREKLVESGIIAGH